MYRQEGKPWFPWSKKSDTYGYVTLDGLIIVCVCVHVLCAMCYITINYTNHTNIKQTYKQQKRHRNDVHGI